MNWRRLWKIKKKKKSLTLSTEKANSKVKVSSREKFTLSASLLYRTFPKVKAAIKKQCKTKTKLPTEHKLNTRQPHK